MKARSYLIVVGFGLALILAAAGAVKPQEARRDKTKSGQEVPKLKAELVQVDVVVTDRQNKPVSVLKREDFELFDNNKPQVINHFSFEEGSTRRFQIADDPEAIRSLPRAITSGELKRVIAFVVDTLHMRFDTLYRTRKVLEDFIDKKMERGDLVLIIGTGGGSGLVQQFTSDQRVLRRAVDRLKPIVFRSDSTTYRSTARTFPSSPYIRSTTLWSGWRTGVSRSRSDGGG